MSGPNVMAIYPNVAETFWGKTEMSAPKSVALEKK